MPSLGLYLGVSGGVMGAEAPIVAPSITLQPSAAIGEINEGQSTSVYVVATGGGLAYQWFKGVSGDTSMPIGGATGSTYTTPALMETTKYWVRVTNTAGSVDSNAVTITVISGGSPLAFLPSDSFAFLPSDTLAFI